MLLIYQCTKWFETERGSRKNKETREDRLLSGVRENELDEDDAGEMFDLENTDNPDVLLAQVKNALSKQVTNSVYSENDGPDMFDDINDERDKLLLEMTEHVRKHKGQRTLLQSRSKDSKEDRINNVLWPNIRYTTVADYSQGTGLPHHGNEQPGETYYYSPLTVNIFGVTDMATEILHAYIYDESEAAKGGNNVTSLLYKDLEEQGIIKAWKDYG